MILTAPSHFTYTLDEARLHCVRLPVPKRNLRARISHGTALVCLPLPYHWLVALTCAPAAASARLRRNYSAFTRRASSIYAPPSDRSDLRILFISGPAASYRCRMLKT